MNPLDVRYLVEIIGINCRHIATTMMCVSLMVTCAIVFHAVWIGSRK